MNGLIAELLRARVDGFTYVDKIAGLVRPITYQRDGETITIPVAIDVVDPLNCDDTTLTDMIPNDQYRTVVYFEDQGHVRHQSRTRGVHFTSKVRLVVWVNTALLNGDPSAADKIMNQFAVALHYGPYNDGPFIGVKHRIEGMPIRGASIFAQYTYPNAVRQYLMWPYDAFAIDISTEFRIRAGCEDEVLVNDVGCWTPPSTSRRRNPSEFTCEELLDPTNGLTAEQLGPECLDCAGGGPCDPAIVTINGTEVATPASGATAALVVKDQNGNSVGAWNGTEWIVTIPEEVPYIAAVYANEAAASADNTTVPTNTQAIKVGTRLYQGNGVSTSAQLIAALVYNPSVTENDVNPWLTTVGGQVYEVQLNQIP